jgi:homogentisate 1,2-dioxygenase
MIKHTPEFTPAAKPASDDRMLAAAYSAAFGTEYGRIVLADLNVKFGPDRPRFKGHSDSIQAARIDGEANVMLEIREAIKAGVPSTGIPTP